MRNSESPQVVVLYSIPPSSAKADNWSDGFTMGVDLLSCDFDIHWINVHTVEDESSIRRALRTSSFVLVKSHWEQLPDLFARRHLYNSSVPRGIVVSGSGVIPSRRAQGFYDVIYSQTHWYRRQLQHSNVIHAYGIDANTMRKEPDQPDLKYDWLMVGSILPYKRPLELCKKSGRRLAVLGPSVDEELLAAMVADGIEVQEWVDQTHLARLYNRAATVLIPCETHGGGERTLMEAMSCGANVEFAMDNPKLAELYRDGPYSHNYYGGQISKGIVQTVGGTDRKRFLRAIGAPYLTRRAARRLVRQSRSFLRR